MTNPIPRAADFEQTANVGGAPLSLTVWFETETGEANFDLLHAIGVFIQDSFEGENPSLAGAVKFEVREDA